MAKQLTKQAKLEMFAMLESVVTDEGWNRVKVAHVIQDSRRLKSTH
jgi:hypothetical protein